MYTIKTLSDIKERLWRKTRRSSDFSTYEWRILGVVH